MAMAIASRYQRLLPSEVLNAATINAAHAVGLGRAVGSVEAGKRADLLILETEDYRAIAYEFGSLQVGRIMKNGSLLFN
jgi:imidazolonepropionase